MKSKMILSIFLALTVLVTVGTAVYVVKSISHISNAKTIPQPDNKQMYLFK